MIRFNVIFRTVFVIVLGFFSSCGDSSEAKKESTSGESEATQDDSIIQISEQMSEPSVSDLGLFKVGVLWAPQPLRAGLDLSHTAHLLFFDSEDQPLESIDFEKFYIHMPMMGHGTDTSDQKIVATQAPHYYRVEGIKFNMMGKEGHWKVEFGIRINGVEDGLTIDIPEVGR